MEGDRNNLSSSDFTTPLLHERHSKSKDNYSLCALLSENLGIKEIDLTVLPANSYALTTILLLNTMIGSGILNQPYVFESSGIFGGLIGYVIGSYLTWLGLVLLTDAGLSAGILEYSGLARRAYGSIGESVIDWSIIIGGFGSQIGYILVIGSTLTELMRSWGCTHIICDENGITSLTVGLLVAPFCLLKHFGHYAGISVFSILTISLVLFLVVVGGPVRGEKIGHVKMFDFLGSIRSIGSVVFALGCAQANFQAFVSTEKRCRNRDSWRKITLTAVSLGSVMCVIMGIVGYLCFKNTTKGEILDNFPGHAFDFFKVMVVIHLILYIPVNFVIMRYSLLNVMNGVRVDHLSWPVHVLFSLLLLAFTALVTLALMNSKLTSGAAFGLILDLTGGIGGSLASFILPAAIYIKLMPTTERLYPYAVATFFLGIAIMLAVVSVTIWGLATAR